MRSVTLGYCLMMSTRQETVRDPTILLLVMAPVALARLLPAVYSSARVTKASVALTHLPLSADSSVRVIKALVAVMHLSLSVNSSARVQQPICTHFEV